LKIKTSVICLLDKSDPPNHSFVDGMLADLLANDSDFMVRLIVSTSNSDRRPYKYKHAVCMPLLSSRKGFGRFVSSFFLLVILPMMIHKDRKRGRNVVLFIRNEPVYLFTAKILNRLFDRVVFQSSFPHEYFRHGLLKLKAARMLYRYSADSVDAVLVVSPTGENRVRQYFPPPCPVLVIPLLSDLELVKLSHIEDSSIYDDHDRPVKFIYIGTHSRQRELDIVLKAIVFALQSDINAEFIFVGGSRQEIDRLRMIEGIDDLENCKQLQLFEKMPRQSALDMLSKADVGLCMIPPLDSFKELSPTKLAEYMGAGLSVLACHGIPLQDKFVSESGGGWLVEWGIDTIGQSIKDICSNRHQITDKRYNALKYANQYLQYKNYYPAFKKLLV